MINMSNNTKVPDSLRREVTALLVSLERNKMLCHCLIAYTNGINT